MLSPGSPWVSEAKGHALSIVLCSKGRMFCRRDDHVLLKLERGFEMLMSGLNVVRGELSGHGVERFFQTVPSVTRQ